MPFELLDPEWRAGVRNADPVVWPALQAVGRLYRANRARLEPHADHIGMIYYGSAFPKTTAQRVMTDVRESGRVSPTAFIHANAGAALSICCTRFGFRGPTMNLTMPAGRARLLVDALAERWLAACNARYLILVASEVGANEDVEMTAALIGKRCGD
jgi:hypothetical protein